MICIKVFTANWSIVQACHSNFSNKSWFKTLEVVEFIVGLCNICTSKAQRLVFSSGAWLNLLRGQQRIKYILHIFCYIL